MGVRIMVGAEDHDGAGKAAMFCSTTGHMLGRLFDSYDDAEAFFQWHEHRWGDVRNVPRAQLSDRIDRWLENVQGNPCGDPRAEMLFIRGETYFEILRAHGGILLVAEHGPGGINDVREDMHNEDAWIKAHRDDGTREATEEEADAYYAMLAGKGVASAPE